MSLFAIFRRRVKSLTVAVIISEEFVAEKLASAALKQDRGGQKKITDYDDVEKVLTLAGNRRKELISTGNRKTRPVL